MPTFVQILDFIGTFAFAISGIRLASAKRFDWFGAYVVGLATAIGGGTIRDVLLDVTPGWMTNPIYLICTGLALIWVICFGRWLIRLNNTFFIFDTIGLALFTVVGVGTRSMPFLNRERCVKKLCVCMPTVECFCHISRRESRMFSQETRKKQSNSI